jgi:hypothetical protein
MPAAISQLELRSSPKKDTWDCGRGTFHHTTSSTVRTAIVVTGRVVELMLVSRSCIDRTRLSWTSVEEQYLEEHRYSQGQIAMRGNVL